MKIFDSTVGLEQVLDHHLARHNVLASNLANAETPGYVPQDLVPPTSPEQGPPLATTHAGHLPTGGQGGEPEAVEFMASGPPEVQLERAMAEVSANRLRYETGVELVRRRMALLRYAATDGGG